MGEHCRYIKWIEKADLKNASYFRMRQGDRHDKAINAEWGSLHFSNAIFGFKTVSDKVLTKGGCSHHLPPLWSETRCMEEDLEVLK